MDSPPPPIPRRELAKWAREELLDAIDEFIKSDRRNDWDADDERALKKERDRIARFLGLEKKS